MIAHARLPETEIDRDRVRDSLTALRLGHDGLEQFLGLLFDELDALRDELDEQRFQLDAERHQLREDKAQIAAERSQWDTDRQHWHDALQKRVVELERDRLALAAELEVERRRNAEMAHAAAEQQRQFAFERTEWAGELRQIRTSFDGRPEVGDRTPEVAGRRSEVRESSDAAGHEKHEDQAPHDDLHPTKTDKARPSPVATVAKPHPKPVNRNPLQADPVMGPLLSQFQMLQKDVARRREKKS